MDECDKAAEMLQCGKENSPEGVAALLNNLELAITVLLLMKFTKKKSNYNDF
jgi:hypothetical protein